MSNLKGLFYKEWLQVRWVFLLFFFIFFYAYLPKINGYFDGDTHGYLVAQSDSILSGIVVTLMILTLLLFKQEKREVTATLILSMPYRKTDIIKVKWLIGLSMIFVYLTFLTLVFFVITIPELRFLQQIDWLFRWLLMSFCFYSVIFSSFILVQTLFNNYIWGLIIGLLLIYLPKQLTNLINGISISMLGYKGGILYEEELLTYMYHIYDSYLYGNEVYFFTQLIVQIAILVLFYKLMTFFFQKNIIESIEITDFKFAEILFRIVLLIYLLNFMYVFLYGFVLPWFIKWFLILFVSIVISVLSNRLLKIEIPIF